MLEIGNPCGLIDPVRSSHVLGPPAALVVTQTRPPAGVVDRDGPSPFVAA